MTPNAYHQNRRYYNQFDDSVVSNHITATKVLVGMNVVIFFLCEIIGDTESSSFMTKAGAMNIPTLVTTMQYWRLFTSMFLHFGIQHLINNMLMLLCFGEALERRLKPFAFTILYLVCGLVGNMVSLTIYLSQGEYVVSAGASGAVFGVFGGLIAITIRNHGQYGYLSFKRLGIMTILALYVGSQSGGTNNIAHVAGAVCGLVMGMCLDLIVNHKGEGRR